MEDSFVQDGTQFGGALTGQAAFLAFHAYLDQSVHLIGAEIRTHLGDDGTSVVLRLKQAGNEQGLVVGQRDGTCLQGEVTVVAGRGENRGVLAPPGLLLFLVGTHQVQDVVTQLGVRDGVAVEESANQNRGGAALAGLNPAERPLIDFDLLRHLGEGQTGRLP